jgi:hypothetical protein
MCFVPDKKITSRTFKIRGALVFLCPKEGEERREKKEERREKRDKRQEMRDERRETRDERQETRDERRETRDEGRETRDERQVSERIKVRAIIFLNRTGQNEKSAKY